MLCFAMQSLFSKLSIVRVNSDGSKRVSGDFPCDCCTAKYSTPYHFAHCLPVIVQRNFSMTL